MVKLKRQPISKISHTRTVPLCDRTLGQSPVTTLLSLLSEGDPEALMAGLTEMDWQKIAELATFHQLGGVLYDKIKNYQSLVPESVFQLLRNEQLKMGMQNVYLYEQLDEQLHKLCELGVEAILLKGAYLAREVYDHLGLRCMSDVDLLVKRQDLEKVESLLLSLGYKPDNCHRVITKRNHHFAYRKKGSITLEVHWKLHWSCLKAMDVNDLWSRKMQLSNGDQQKVYAFSPEDLLLHLCLHNALHIQNMKLRMIYDLKVVLQRFASQFDFSVMVERAKKWKIQGSVYVFLRLARDLLGHEINSNFLSELEPALEPADFDEKKYTALLEKLTEERSLDQSCVMGASSMLLWSEKSLRYKWKLLREHLLVSPRVISLKYPASAKSIRVFFYYPLYWAELSRKTIRLLGQGRERQIKNREHVDRINEMTDLRQWMLGIDSEEV